MRHGRDFFLPFSRPRASAFGVIVTARCADCHGIGSAISPNGDVATCEPCEGTGEVEVYDGETDEIGHA